MIKTLRQNFAVWGLAIFWLITLFNPVLKKYDYGAEYPMVLVFGVLLGVLAIFELKRVREMVSVEKLFLLLFGLFVILSFAFSQTKNLGFSEVLAFLSMAVFYLIFAGQKIEWRERFLRIVKLATVVAVMIGFVLYFTLEETRMFGPFFNILHRGNVWPNAFALFLLMTWPLFLVRSGKKESRHGIVRIALIVFVLAALFLTFSRGAALVLGGQIILLGIYFFRKIKCQNFVLAACVLALSIGVFLGANYLRGLNHKTIDVEERVTFGNNEAQTSGQERMDFWKESAQLALEKPFFGWGPFSFRYAYNPIQKTFLANADHPHNIFLKIAVENGIPAVVCFAAFLLGIFVLVVRRWKSLEENSKNLIFVLGLGVIGALAHSLIDYNFNFLANLILFFVYLIFIRSLLVRKEEVGRNFSTLIFALIIAVIGLYEGSILVRNNILHEPRALEHSLYPRNFYLGMADQEIHEKKYDDAMYDVLYQLELNPLDAQAWHLKAAMDCGEEYFFNNAEDCEKDVKKVLALNPMNNFDYYLGYFRAAFNAKLPVESEEFAGVLERTSNLLEHYFNYVAKNVHFTAYTPNVEAAAELIDLLVAENAKHPVLFDQQKIQNIKNGKRQMLETAEKLRAQKTF